MSHGIQTKEPLWKILDNSKYGNPKHLQENQTHPLSRNHVQHWHEKCPSYLVILLLSSKQHHLWLLRLLLHQKQGNMLGRDSGEFRDDQDQAKKHLLAIINGRKVKHSQEQLEACPEWYKGYFQELLVIREEIVRLNPDLYEWLWRIRRPITSMELLSITSCAPLKTSQLMAAFDYLTQENIEVSALVFDGLMVHKKDVKRINWEKLLRGCQDDAKQIVGCDNVFCCKEMEEGYELPQVQSTKPGKEVFLSTSKYHDRTPGLFKLEFKGTKMIYLSSKCYYAEDENQKSKFSCKGVSKKTNSMTWKEMKGLSTTRETSRWKGNQTRQSI